MPQDESKHHPIAEGAKTVLGIGLQTIAIWVGVVVLFTLIFGIGLWLFGLFTN